MGKQDDHMSQVCAEETFAEAEGITHGTELLKGQYLIQSLLSSGGFGITYVARDSLARQVVIKECFPADLCKREGTLVEPVSPELKLQFSAIKNQFIREARQMAQLVHPNIVAVHQVFEENNTAYMALDMINGIDLVTLAENEPQRITNTLLRSVLRQSLKAINFIHGKGLLHRDISPDNIMLDSKSHLTLIDFGAARECDEQKLSTVMAVKDGYSPYEFYEADTDHGFHSDLYSLAATIYFLAVGSAPPSSEDRKKALDAGDPDPYEPLVDCKSRLVTGKDKQIFATVDRALSMDPEQRYDSVAAWAKDLVNRQREAGSEVSTPAPVPPQISEMEIAELVKTANEQLDSLKNRAKKRQPEVEKPKETPVPKIMVDIFGNPVEDLLDWHEKQEVEIRAREMARQAQLQLELTGGTLPGTEDDQAEHTGSDLQTDFTPIEEQKPRRRRNRLAAFLSRCLNTQDTHAPR